MINEYPCPQSTMRTITYAEYFSGDYNPMNDDVYGTYFTYIAEFH